MKELKAFKKFLKEEKSNSIPLKKQDKIVANALDKMGIPYTIDTEWAEELWGMSDPLIKIENPKTQEPLYIGYDRYGYVIDGPGSDNEEEIDQEDIKTVLQFIKKLFK